VAAGVRLRVRMRGVFWGAICQVSPTRHISHTAMKVAWSLPRSKDFNVLSVFSWLNEERKWTWR
jgi:hypothetical protein